MTFEEIYKARKTYVLRVCYKWTRNEQAAEEASQDFFMWIHRNLHTFDLERSTFDKWFTSHLVFKLGHHSHMLKKKGRGGIGEVLLDEKVIDARFQCNTTQKEINRAGIRASLINSLDRLTPGQRRVMQYYIDTDMTPPEIGKELGITGTGVSFHFKKARPQLRKALEKEYVSYSGTQSI